MGEDESSAGRGAAYTGGWFTVVLPTLGFLILWPVSRPTRWLAAAPDHLVGSETHPLREELGRGSRSFLMPLGHVRAEQTLPRQLRPLRVLRLAHQSSNVATIGKWSLGLGHSSCPSARQLTSRSDIAGDANR
jgi:hypothetical protein